MEGKEGKGGKRFRREKLGRKWKKENLEVRAWEGNRKRKRENLGRKEKGEGRKMRGIQKEEIRKD